MRKMAEMAKLGKRERRVLLDDEIVSGRVRRRRYLDGQGRIDRTTVWNQRFFAVDDFRKRDAVRADGRAVDVAGLNFVSSGRVRNGGRLRVEVGRRDDRLEVNFDAGERFAVLRNRSLDRNEVLRGAASTGRAENGENDVRGDEKG